MKRLDREKKTISIMVEMYCNHHHSSQDGLCTECAELLDYAMQRHEKCPFGAEKPVCSRCTVHCYKPRMREKIRSVMRWSGPRMIKEHPFLAAQHIIEGKIFKPSKK